MKRLLFTILALCVLCVGLQAQNTNTSNQKGVTSQGQLDTVRNTREHPTTQDEPIQSNFVDQFGTMGKRPGLSPYGQRLKAVIKVTSNSIVSNSVLATTASIAATVSDSGDYALPVIERGVCYATAANPTLLTATKVHDATISGKGFGDFEVSLSGLQPNTAYHARAYAVSLYDTVYGTDLTFTTLFLAGSISYATTAVEKLSVDVAFTNPLTHTGDGTVAYAVSSGDDICTVNAGNGLVTLKGTAGTCIITATVTDGPQYAYATKTASYTLMVSTATALQTPLTFEAKTAGATVTFTTASTLPNLSIEYSLNGGTWTTYESAITLSSIGEKVSFRGDNNTYATANYNPKYSTISCSADCYIYGNIMSLVSSENYADTNELTGDYAFCGLFDNNTHIVNHPSKTLVLPARTLTNHCYEQMFYGCTGLTTAPALPAETLAEGCYRIMFDGCTSLIQAPALPAETLAEWCYTGMFSGCTSLTSAPALPAMSMAPKCYQSMFFDCSSLATAPALPATSLANHCYDWMFSHCTSLTAAPALPATTLANHCYEGMFIGCTSLTTAPVLPATTLSPYCYQNMFVNCSNLNSVTCLATDISADDCTNQWLYGVAETGTFIKPASMNDWTIDSPNGIPVGWTAIPVVPGKFSVNANGDQVYFSQGNLRATNTTANSTSGWTWSFAEHQYDYVGNAIANTALGNNTVTTAGTVDLFGWVGTNSSFAAYGINSEESDSFYGHVTSEPLKSDWGHNVITNGGNIADIWRTLTKDEWVWIIGPSSNANPGTNCRTSSTVGGTANARFTYATINGIYKGMIIFPDSYTAGTPTGVTWGTINNYSNYTTTCTTEGWEALEAAGCVFLPAAGVRGGNTIYDVASRGNYWSSTAHESDANHAYSMHFYLNEFNPVNHYMRRDGYSIRLVRSTKPIGSLSYATTSVNKTMTDNTPFTNPLTLVGDGTVTYARSAGDEICTVDATTGLVTLNGTIGSCTITATVTDGPLYAYNMKTASYTLTVTPVGALPGKFTINTGGGKVHFSQGNLQYQANSTGAASAPYTGVWKFAEHQYDMIGSDNANISDSYTGWIDLFGWGTGDAPTKATQNNSDYSTFTDWGVNAISNGGNTADKWHTLTKDEWVYLFEHHTKGWSTVNGVNGYVIRPDGISTAVASSYTASEWAAEEAAGSVFLPAACSRGGTTFNAGSWGDYWSLTPYNSDDAYYLYFNSGGQNPASACRWGGRSVRLVYEPPYFLGAGTEADPYLISSEADWNYLAIKVNSGTNYSGKFFRLTADINVTTMVGNSESNSFRGTFDGDGHTLTISYNTTSDYTASFRYIQGATFKNLKVTGSITTTMNQAAGIAGLNTNAVATFDQCATDVTINSSSTTEVGWGRVDYHGGLLARTNSADVNITDCVCGGSVNGSDSPSSIAYGAGFVGVAVSCTVTGTRCLSTTSYTNVNVWNSLCHAADATRSVNVFYYVNGNDAANVGTQVTTSQLADGSYATTLQAGRSTTVWVQYSRTNQPMLKQFAKYTVTYNANGGSGSVPAAQAKQHGDDLTLSNSTLTLSGFTHTGWNTNSDGSGTHYDIGGTYSANADVTLYAEWTSLTFNYTGTVQTFTVPATGYYTLECYGAQGGYSSSGLGGLGGKSELTYYLTQGDVLYLYVGGQGGCIDGSVSHTEGGEGGWNGGGKGGTGVQWHSQGNPYNGGGGGGGATHIATSAIGPITGSTDFSANHTDLLLIAGGGGGGLSWQANAGGAGGGDIGGKGRHNAEWSIAWNNGTLSCGKDGMTSSTGSGSAEGCGGGGAGFVGGNTWEVQYNLNEQSYSGAGGSSWGETTNGKGYSTTTGGATAGGNGKVVITWYGTTYPTE